MSGSAGTGEPSRGVSAEQKPAIRLRLEAAERERDELRKRIDSLIEFHERCLAQRVVIRVWPVGGRKLIVEAFADDDCEVEVVTLPLSSAWGSKASDDVTRLSLTPLGARVFSRGRRVFNGPIELQTLEESLSVERETTLNLSLMRACDKIERERAAETKARIERWQKLARGEE